MDFKSGHVVYCPRLTTKPLLLESKKGVNGVFLRYRGVEYWYSVGGVPNYGDLKAVDRYKKNLPEIFFASEGNRFRLSDLYGIEFLDFNQINIYGVNVLDGSGSSTNNWMSDFDRGKSRPICVPDECITINNFVDEGVFVSPSISSLEEVKVFNKNSKIVCLGKGSIWVWSEDWFEGNYY